MRGIRAVRACAGAAILAVALAATAPAHAGITPPQMVEPAVATGGGETALAWTTRSVVQVTTLNADGSFAPVVTLGPGEQSPQLAISPAGDQMVVWQSGEELHSAFRARAGAWAFQTVASDVVGYSPPRLVMDSTGRAIAAWITYPETAPQPISTSHFTLLVSTHLPGAGWSAPLPLASGVYNVSLAIDGSDDIVVTYTVQADTDARAIWASALPAGATTWDPPVRISGNDKVVGGAPAVTGGGARTFLATWGLIDPVPNTDRPQAARAARLRLPGGWEAPRDVVPASPLTFGTYGHVQNWSAAVDGLGNAVMALQFPASALGSALGTARLPASADSWTPPVTLDLPERLAWSDAPPAVAFAADGAATAAFFRLGARETTLRVATVRGALGAWQGQATDAASLSPCSYKARCAWEWKVAPVLGLGHTTAVIALQTYPQGVVVAYSRLSPGGQWKGPVTLSGPGPTQVYLRSAHVRKGYVRVYAACTLPPCRGTVVLRTADGARRMLGRIPFAIGSAYPVSAPFLLPRWARAALKHGGRLRTQVAFDALEGNGTQDRAERTVLLHA